MPSNFTSGVIYCGEIVGNFSVLAATVYGSDLGRQIGPAIATVIWFREIMLTSGDTVSKNTGSCGRTLVIFATQALITEDVITMDLIVFIDIAVECPFEILGGVFANWEYNRPVL
jgi:hypothetical protein